MQEDSPEHNKWMIHIQNCKISSTLLWCGSWNPVMLTSPFPLCSTQQQYLRSEDEGKEEVTLQLLLNLSAQCGVCFPCTPSSSSALHPQATPSSVHLVHTVRDDASLEVMHCMILNAYNGGLLFSSTHVLICTLKALLVILSVSLLLTGRK